MNAVIAVMPVMPSADAEDGGEDRQAGGDQRAEGEQQDDQRDARCRSARRSRRAAPRSAMPEPLASTVRPASRAWSMSVGRARRWWRARRRRRCRRRSVKLMVPTRPSADSGESASALASASAGGRAALLGGRRGSAWLLGLGRVDRVGQRARPAGICGRSPRSATRASTAFEYVGSSRVWPFGRGDDDGDRGLVEGVGGAGEELGLEVGGLLRRDARDRERVAHRLGEVGGDGADGDHAAPASRR